MDKLLEELALRTKNQTLIKILFKLNIHIPALAYNNSSPKKVLNKIDLKHKKNWFVQSGLETNKNYK